MIDVISSKRLFSLVNMSLRQIMCEVSLQHDCFIRLVMVSKHAYNYIMVVPPLFWKMSDIQIKPTDTFSGTL
jgi:hypothetical protein